jgi:hypothetical protein
MSVHDEQQLARLLRLLPPPPRGWVEAAQELPPSRGALDRLVAQAEEDAAFRAAVLADLEGAISAVGAVPSPAVVSRARQLLGGT